MGRPGFGSGFEIDDQRAVIAAGDRHDPHVERLEPARERVVDPQQTGGASPGSPRATGPLSDTPRMAKCEVLERDRHASVERPQGCGVEVSTDEDPEYSYDELLRTLLNAPLFEKPVIGRDPFQPLKRSRPDRTSDGVRQVMTDAAAGCYGN